jgi:hypothetical protein
LVRVLGEVKDLNHLPPTSAAELLLRRASEVVVPTVSGKGELVFDFPIVIISAWVTPTAALLARWNSATPTVELLQGFDAFV